MSNEKMERIDTSKPGVLGLERENSLTALRRTYLNGVQTVEEKHTSYPDWMLGLEHIEQSGSPVWAQIRTHYGLDPDEFEALTRGEVMWEEVRMYEDRSGIPPLTYLSWLARLEGVSVGALLDHILISVGSELLREEDE